MAETKIGKYTITGELGKGAMGIVYKGVDPYIGRTLAIKTIRFDIMGQPSAQEEAQMRFMREARSAGNLSHPNIVTIYEVGEDVGTTYIAMEYIDGQSLEDIVASGRQFTPEEVIDLIEQIGSALDYAHQKGITHRDIKPGNILIDSEGVAHIVDFGIARIATSTLTQTSMVMGTPSYMSPEQIAGKKVDGRSDIFSLGTIMYELLTNEKPFPGENLTTIVYKIMNETPPPPKVLSPEIPDYLDAIVKKALEKNPRERYQSCKELLGDLRNLGASAVTSIPRKSRTPETIPHYGDQLVSEDIVQEESLPQSSPQVKKNKKPLLIVLGSMMGVLIVVLTAFFLTMGKSGKSGINIPVSADKPVEKIQPVAPLNTQADYELAAQEAFAARDVNKLEKILEDGMRQYNNSSKLWVYKTGYFSLVSQDPQSNENAQGAATTAVNLDQSNLDNYYELGQIFQNIMKDYSIALEYYQKGETKGLIRDDLSYQMALCLENLKNPKNAITYYERFLKATPDHNLAVDAKTRLAALKKPKKKKIKTKKVQVAYEKAVWDKVLNEKFKEIKKDVEQGLKLYPNSSKLWAYRAIHLLSDGTAQAQDIDKALEAANKALSLNQSDPQIYIILNTVYRAKGSSSKYDEIEKTYALSHPELYFEIAKTYEQVKERNAAIDYYHRFLEAAPRHKLVSDAQTRLAKLEKPGKKKIKPSKLLADYEKIAWDAIRNEDIKKMGQTVDEGLRFYPNSSRLWALKALDSLESGKSGDRKKRALEAANKALKLNSSDPFNYIVLKEVYDETGSDNLYEQREKAYARDHPEFYYRMAKLYEELILDIVGSANDLKQQAVKYYDTFLKASPYHRLAEDARKRLARLEPDPPRKKRVFDIPILSANVSKLNFYEKGEKNIPQQERRYRNRFSKSESRYIRWELNLTHPAPGRRIDFNIEAIWYKSDGSVLYKQTNSTRLEADWKSSWHAKGWGWKVPGNWEPGNYRVDLFVEGKTVASGSFEIYHEKKQQAAKGYIPSLKATVTKVRFYEGGADGIPYNQRVYSNRFARIKSRYIYWELNLDYPAPGRRTNFKIDAVWYKPDGSVFHRQTKSAYFEASWKNSWHILGSGWEKSGNWQPGNYRVDLFVEGRIVTSGFFEIYK